MTFILRSLPHTTDGTTRINKNMTRALFFLFIFFFFIGNISDQRKLPFQLSYLFIFCSDLQCLKERWKRLKKSYNNHTGTKRNKKNKSHRNGNTFKRNDIRNIEFKDNIVTECCRIKITINKVKQNKKEYRHYNGKDKAF